MKFRQMVGDSLGLRSLERNWRTQFCRACSMMLWLKPRPTGSSSCWDILTSSCASLDKCFCLRFRRGWRVGVFNGVTISTDSLVVFDALQMQNEIQVVQHGRKRTKLPFNSCFLRSESISKRWLYVLGFAVCILICLRHFAQEHHNANQLQEIIHTDRVDMVWHAENMQ